MTNLYQRIKSRLSKKDVAVDTIIGVSAGAGGGYLNNYLTNDITPKSVVKSMTEKGFTSVKQNNGRIEYFGLSSNVPAKWNGEAWVLDSKYNIKKDLAVASIPSWIANASLLAAPLYMKKHPEWFLPHVLAVLGTNVGHTISMSNIENMEVYSGSKNQSWTLGEFIKRPEISNSGSSVFGWFKAIPYMIGAVCGAIGYKLGMKRFEKYITSLTPELKIDELKMDESSESLDTPDQSFSAHGEATV